VTPHILFFNALLAGSCGYALARGGPPERIVGAALLTAYAATLASYSDLASRFYTVERGVFAVDLLLLIVLVAVALRADRGWPLVLAGLQLDGVGAHLLKLLDVQMIRVAYALMIAAGSYPMVILLAIGTWRHRQRLEMRRCDRAWRIRSNAGASPTIPA
jgi:hypothetical protein